MTVRYLLFGLLFGAAVFGICLLVDMARTGRLYRMARRAAKERKRGNVAAAVAIMEKVVAREPKDALLIAHFGAALLAAGRTAEAENRFRAALALEPNLTEALHGLGYCRLPSDPEAARDCFDRVIANEPRLSAAFEGRGLAHLQADRIAEAEADFERARALDPKAARVRMNLGVARLARGDDERAEADFREALRLRPGDTLVLSNLGALLGARQRYAEAAEILGQAVALRPELVKERVELAYALKRCGRADESMAQLEAAKNLEPNNADIIFRLAFLYEAAGRRSEAEILARQAETLDPRLKGDREVMQEDFSARNEKLRFFASLAIFRDLEPDTLSRIVAAGRSRSLADGEVLCADGSPSEAFYIIEEGAFEVRKRTIGARTRSLTTLNKGDLLGEISFFDRGARSASVVARGNARALEIPFAAIERLIIERPLAGQAILRNFARPLADRLRAVNEAAHDQIVWGIEAAGAPVEP